MTKYVDVNDVCPYEWKNTILGWKNNEKKNTCVENRKVGVQKKKRKKLRNDLLRREQQRLKDHEEYKKKQGNDSS